jgi:O-methyltransferase
MLRSLLKSFVLNTRLPDRLQLGHWIDFNSFGAWIKESGAGEKPTFPERRSLYRFVSESYFPRESIDYLEFGVYEGASIREWIALNRHESSRFFGFDCFYGLPETWNLRGGAVAVGTFDTGGQVPNVGDSRVTFTKGLFQQSLPGFLEHFEPRSRLVIHLDADLYSSTLYVLSRLHELMVPGTILFFDEFITEEYRALKDYAASHMRKYSVLATSGHLHDQVCVVLDE